MKVALVVLVIVGVFSYSMAYSESSSCSCVNGICDCTGNKDANGNAAGSASRAFGGPQGGSGSNTAGAGQLGGPWSQQSSSFGVGMPPVMSPFAMMGGFAFGR